MQILQAVLIVFITAMAWLKEMSHMGLQTHLPEHSINKH